MKFTLYYRGPLTANGKPTEKHEIRKQFHKQLKELWNQKPLSDHRDDLLKPNTEPKEIGILKSINGYIFAPLVSSRINCIADVEISILRPESPGNIITQSGDIDNRLKTLFDSLKVPDANGFPKDFILEEDEKPFFCLLEDDNLITKVNVKTDRLLEPNVHKNEVVLVIEVNTHFTSVVVGTIGLLG